MNDSIKDPASELESLLADFHTPLRSRSAMRLERLVEQHPDFLPGLGTLAWRCLCLRQYSRAAEIYRRIEETSPGLPGVYELLGHAEEALRQLRDMQDRLELPGPHREQALKRIHGLWAFEEGRPPMEMTAPWDVAEPFHQAAALAQLCLGMPEAARISLEKAGFRSEPLSSWESRFLRLIQFLVKLPVLPFSGKAIRSLIEVAQRHYTEHPATERPPWALFWIAALPSVTADHLVEIAKAFRQLRSRAYPYLQLEAGLYQFALDASSTHEGALRGLALVCYDREDMPGLADAANSMLERFPRSPFAPLALGASYSETHDWENAAKAYQAGLKFHPDNPEILLHLGLVQAEKNQMTAARATLQRVSGNLSAEIMAHFAIGTLEKLPPKSLLEADQFLRDCLSSLGGAEELLERQDSIAQPMSTSGDRRWESTLKSCPLCGGDAIRPSLKAGPESLPVSCCMECGFYHLNPSPNLDGAMHRYARNYLDGMYLRIVEWCRASEGSEDGLYGLYHNTFTWLERDPAVDFRNLPTGKALDVGCAVGAMPLILKRRGWEAAGVEPSEPLAQLAIEQGLEIYTGFLEEQGFKAETFDLATLMHVLEHVPNPMTLLNEISRITRPGGHLLLSLPVSGILRHYVHGGDYFIQPDHVSFFSPANIHRMLEKCGYEVVAFATPEDMVHAFDRLREGQLPWHPALVRRMVEWKQGSFLDVFAVKKG